MIKLELFWIKHKEKFIALFPILCLSKWKDLFLKMRFALLKQVKNV